MSFTGNESQLISLQDASDLTQNYRDAMSSGDTIAHYFGKSVVENILAQEGCVGVRIYYGLDSLGKKQLVMVGVDCYENDLYQGLIADRSAPCPSNCSTSNPLNS